MQTGSYDRKELARYTSVLAIASGGLIVFMSLVFLLFTGNTTQLTCRGNGGQTVDCAVKNTWFGLFVINEQALRDVRQAETGEHCDEDGDCTYRLELVTRIGSRVPLTAFYSAGRPAKQAVQEQINAYLQKPGAEPLAIKITGASGQLGSALLASLTGISGVGLIIFGSRLWQRSRVLTSPPR